jgi:hypothetical protein
VFKRLYFFAADFCPHNTHSVPIATTTARPAMDGMLVEMKDFFKKNFIPIEHPI